MLDIDLVIKQIARMKEMTGKEEYDVNQPKTGGITDPKIPTDFECFVCGTKFLTNEERKQHLRSGTHGHLYDTASPQEEEEIRTLED
jgi:hypothetical protein